MSDWVFDRPNAQILVQAKLDHLAHLSGFLNLRGRVLEVGCGLGHVTGFFEELGCDVVSTEGRQENISENLRRHPTHKVLRRDVVVPGSHNDLGKFDVVILYGVLYHTHNPAEVIGDLAKLCIRFMLVSTCVASSDNYSPNLVAEPKGLLDQSIHGMGCRPGRPWVMRELKRHFRHVYVPVYQPAHDDFRQSFPAQGDALRRTVFIASRKPVISSFVSERLPSVQEVWR